ncbi:MAG: MCE family protein [Candidatus Riflebacteria bacterium]|nr:MCE family protein [Candidatus Riflebacteria bacterium]
MSSSVKVGIITFFALLLLAYMVFVIGDIGFREAGYRFKVTFYSVNGLTPGSSVLMSGVKIGKVEKIEIIDDKVRVHCYIKDAQHLIRMGSTFTIGASGLMGEKFLEIIPTRDYTAPYVQRDREVTGTDPTRMEELFEQGNELLKRLKGLVSSARDVIGDPEMKQSAKNFLKNAELSSENIKEMIESVKTRIDSIVAHLDNVMANVDDEIGKSRENIRELIINLRNFGKNLNDISTENKTTIREMLNNIKQVSSRIDKLIEELNRDNKMTDNMKASVESLKKASDNAKEITNEVKEIIIEKDIRKKIKTSLDDAHKIAQAVDKVFVNIKQTRIDFKYLLRYNKEDDVFFSDLMLDIYPNENNFYRLGVEDIGGDPLFNLMLARDAQSKLIKRGGVISSKVGLGVDYRWADNISYSVDFIDTRDPKVRFTSAYIFKPGLILQLRVDDIAREKDINFGLEYKF